MPNTVQRQRLSCLIRKRTLEGLRDSGVLSLTNHQRNLSSKIILPPQHIRSPSKACLRWSGGEIPLLPCLLIFTLPALSSLREVAKDALQCRPGVFLLTNVLPVG